jgi:hypothetical protein
MEDRKTSGELVVITKAYDLILWSCNHTGKFPRNHRFVLGERIEWDPYKLMGPILEGEGQILLDRIHQFIQGR